MSRTPSITQMMLEQDWRDQVIVNLMNTNYRLKEIMYRAIKAGDWKVDGACDPAMYLDGFKPVEDELI